MLTRKRQKIKLILMIIITGIFFCVEIGIGYWTKSIALISDAYNMLSDLISLVIGLACLILSTKSWNKNTFGWARAEVMGALVNSVFLISLCFSITTDSIERLAEPEPIQNPWWLLGVGIGGLVVNGLGIIVFCNETSEKDLDFDLEPHLFGDMEEHFHRHEFLEKMDDDENSEKCLHHGSSPSLQGSVNKGFANDNQDYNMGLNIDDEVFKKKHSIPDINEDIEKKTKIKSGNQMNIQGVFLHILGDALGSVVVIISALIVLYVKGDWKFRVDPILSMFMVVVMLATTIPLFRQSSKILLQNLPSKMRVRELTKKIHEKVEGLKGVHELHVWQLVGSRIIASMHIKCTDLAEYVTQLKKIKKFFHENDIHSVTVQPEFIGRQANIGSFEQECSIECPDGFAKCLKNTCCSVIHMKEMKKSLKSQTSSDIFHEVVSFQPSVTWPSSLNEIHSNTNIRPQPSMQNLPHTYTHNTNETHF